MPICFTRFFGVLDAVMMNAGQDADKILGYGVQILQGQLAMVELSI